MKSSPAVRRYIAAATLTAGLGCLIALAVGGPGFDDLPLALSLALLMLAACLWPLHAAPKLNVTLDTAVVFAAVLLLAPGPAMLMLGLGMAGAQLLRRQPGAQVAFNTAQAMLQAGAAGGLLLVGGWRQHGMPLRDPLQLALLAGAALSISLVNTSLVSGVITLQTGSVMRAVWVEALLVMPWQDLAQLAAGVALAVALTSGVWWALMLAAPLALPLQVGLQRVAAAAQACPARVRCDA